MEFVILFLTLMGGVIIYAIIAVCTVSPGKKLHQNMVSLGTLTGKTYDEIVEVCGEANSVSTTTKNRKRIIIRQWITTGYHIVLLFDKNDICLGVSSETDTTNMV